MSNEKTLRKAYLTIIKSDKEIAVKDIVADYEPALALGDIESIYNSDKFISEVPEGETRYVLEIDGEDIDINPTDEDVSVNLDAIIQNILEKLYLCDCYADLISWNKVEEDTDQYDTVQQYRKYRFIDEIMQNQTSLTSVVHPSTNVLLNITDNLHELYDSFETTVDEIINLYQLYIYNFSEEMQVIMDNQLVSFEYIKEALKEDNINECN